MTKTKTHLSGEKTQTKVKAKRGIIASSVMTVLVSKRMFLRAFFTCVVLSISVYIIWLLFNTKPESGQEQLLNIFLGSYIAILTKAVDFWFRRDDEDSREQQTDPFD